MKQQKHSPLTEATYYILLSLTEDMHGYGIMRRVEQLSQNRIKLAAGTLYGALNTLTTYKLIEAKGVDELNKRRKLYGITENGRELLVYEVNRMKEMYTNGLMVLGGDYNES